MKIDYRIVSSRFKIWKFLNLLSSYYDARTIAATHPNFRTAIYVHYKCMRVNCRIFKKKKLKAKPLESNTNSEKLEVYSLSAHVTWLLFTNKHSILMIDINLQTFRSFQPTFRFHMPFLNFKARIISAHQIEQSWCLETYKLFVPALKQLAHPLFSSYSAVFWE